MTGHDIILIGASAGGVVALRQLVKGFPAGLPAAVFVVFHVPAGGVSLLPSLLTAAGTLPAAHAVDGEPIHPGRIYVAPPDYHLHLEAGRVRLGVGPRENHARPAVDPLFRSAARVYGRRVVAVVLTGALNDGSAGLLAVRSAGGLAVVQDPRDAFQAAMPENALATAGADHVVPLAEMAPLLVRLVQQPISTSAPSVTVDPVEKMEGRVREDKAAQVNGQRTGQPSVYSCPECGGVLWQVDSQGPLQFRCHVGHTYYGDNLLAEQSEALEAGLWIAARMFIEKATLSRQLAVQERRRGDLRAAERFEEQAQVSDHYAALIKQHLIAGAVALETLPAASPEALKVPRPPNEDDKVTR